MIELIERKIEKGLLIRKVNVYILIASVSTFILSFFTLLSNSLESKLVFIIPLILISYYFYRINKYKKDLEYLPKFLMAYSRAKELEELKGEDIEPVKSKIKIVEKIVKVPVEKIVEKIIYKDKIIEKPIEKVVYKEKIIYKDKEPIKLEGYVKKKDIYEHNDIYRDIEEMLAKQFYNLPLKDRAIRIYELINQKNVDAKIYHEHEKIKKGT